MPNFLLAVDPGYKQSGIALFQHTRLIYAALIEISEPDLDLAAHWQNTADRIHKTARRYTLRYGNDYMLNTAVELMQIDSRTGTAHAIQLLRLSGLAGAVCSLATGEAAGYQPSKWNKNRSKGPNHAKILRQMLDVEKVAILKKAEKITDGERKNLCESLRPKITTADELYIRAVDERTGQAEHVLDAVGIGLYHLGRLR